MLAAGTSPNLGPKLGAHKAVDARMGCGDALVDRVSLILWHGDPFSFPFALLL